MNTFLSVFVTVISLGTIFGCLALLIWCSRDKMGMEDGAPTGHTYDGISELNNPLPKWWSYLFVFMVVFSLAYLALYPGLGNFKGLLGWTSSNQDVRSLEEYNAAAEKARTDELFVQYDREMIKADEVFGAKFRELTYQADGETYLPIAEIAQNEEATQVGQRLFLQNCAQCHGSDARGARGFPNLTDNDWLYGGEPAQIKKTIMDGRQGVMASWEAMLGDEGVREVTSYVLSLSGRKVDAVEAQKGKARFAVCAACHGPEGKGQIAMGAPNLTDNIWLYGGSRAAVEDTIRHGRHGVMPAWKDILGEDKIQLLSAYVYSLSNNK
ncbi:cytochrome-c oxidase, cbb3-type subunit III [Oceanisphaera pacifica]|uniref:Cbb3-type cytochrome c oxidase subunit n=1 Tax=Oceanisphaera pacifica TaxID=2818389 RepID=A0ABS3NFW1_9GAMM|nr:cytochrome-c oxidase, cbb3-type subunit III [Oceanisphaera pacifica]MBO1519457.1 cytochrome-c oxidase, cbb3-type subunit III [Oceanisphaera pacifica]